MIAIYQLKFSKRIDVSYDLEDIKDQLEDGTAQLLDVREQDEWDAGHLADAKLVTLSSLQDGVEPKGLTSPDHLHPLSQRPSRSQGCSSPRGHGL